MRTIEFYASIRDGVLHIPRRIREVLDTTSRVRVILFVESPSRVTPNLVDHLLAHPLHVPEFQPLPRDAAHT